MTAGALDREQRLQEALAACLEAAETGEAEDRERLLARYPEFAAELAELWANHALMERYASPLREIVPPTPTAAPTLAHGDTVQVPPQGGLPRQFGDYELLEATARASI